MDRIQCEAEDFLRHWYQAEGHENYPDTAPGRGLLPPIPPPDLPPD